MGLRDEIRRIRKAGAIVLGLSRDAPATLRKWKEKLELPYELLSDPEHEVLAAYGAWGEKSMYGKKVMGVIRSHFIIDPQGRLADVQIKVSPQQSIERALTFLAGGGP
jgi:peroxiredoxin Q/BCP